jgi:hypothetical protein
VVLLAELADRLRLTSELGRVQPLTTSQLAGCCTLISL